MVGVAVAQQHAKKDGGGKMKRKRRAAVLLAVLALAFSSARNSSYQEEAAFAAVALVNHRFRGVGYDGDNGASSATATSSGGGGGGGGVRFVFFMGLEGTAHHLLKSILIESPAAKRLQEMGLFDGMKDLARALYHGRFGYLHRHCFDKGVDPDSVRDAHDEVVRLLRGIAANVTAGGSSGSASPPERATTSGGDYVLSVPLNGIDYFHDQMASYPQNNGECRPKQYPNLDLLYAVCRDAGVVCQHAYLYRDPHDIIRSTTVKRNFNRRGALEALQLYTTMLDVIYGQLSRYPDKTLACLGLLEPKVSKAETWDPIEGLFWGSDESAAFRRLVGRIYKASSKPMSDAEKEKLVPYKPHMAIMVKVHENVLNLCREQVRARGVD